MLRWLLCLPAAAIAITAVAGELARPQAEPSARLAATLEPDRPVDGLPEPETRPTSGGVRRSADGLYRVDAMVNGARVEFVVDTGSSVVVLTQSDARRAGLDTGGDARVAVQTANGHASMKMGRIDDLRVGGRSISRVQAAVVEDGLTTSLLGQSALAKLESLSIRNGVLTFGDAS